MTAVATQAQHPHTYKYRPAYCHGSNTCNACNTYFAYFVISALLSSLLLLLHLSLFCSSSLSVLKECAAGTPTTYFWFRNALDITDSIDETGELNLTMTGCLFAAWAIVCLGMFKGIKSSGKVIYPLCSADPYFSTRVPHQPRKISTQQLIF